MVCTFYKKTGCFAIFRANEKFSAPITRCLNAKKAAGKIGGESKEHVVA